MKRYFLLVMLLLLFCAGGGAIYFANHAEAQGGPGGKMPPIPVNVKTVQPETVRLWNDFSGRLLAVDEAEIRPEVTGRITEIRFQDGQNVKAGEILFVIDPRTYEANLAKAEAALASARSNAQFAKTEYVRATDLIKSEAIAQRVFDQRESDHKTASANVQSAEAAVKQARLDVEHAYVRAPISGRVSRAEVTLGNLVLANISPPVLTTIVSNDGIYADFDVDEQTYLASIRAGANNSHAEREVPVELNLPGDKDHPYKGTIYSFDNKINPATGTIRARAKFKNEDGALVPGMFASIRLSSSVETQDILVPERALGTDQNKKFVFVVGPENKVQYREVQLGHNVGERRIVLSGLKPGDRIVTDGVQHIRPDAVVVPQEETAAPDAVIGSEPIQPETQKIQKAKASEEKAQTK